MEFQYTLTPDEYLDYCKYQMLGEPTFKKLRHRCWFILPVGAVLLLVAFFPLPWWAYPIAAAASLLWVLLVNYLVARTMINAARQRRDQAGATAYRPLKVTLDEKDLKVNGSRQSLRNYRFFSNLVLMFLGDDSCVILPQRVFGESKEDLRRVVGELELCMKK